MFTDMNLFKPVGMKIIKFLAERADKEFYEREIAKQAGVSIGATNQILRNLSEKSIVNRERRGKMFFYRYNLENPISREFKVLFNIMFLAELVQEMKEYSKEIILFGSAATGEDTAESDVDVFIHTTKKPEAEKIVLKFDSESEREISPIIVDSEGYAKLKAESKALIERVKRGRILWQA